MGFVFLAPAFGHETGASGLIAAGLCAGVTMLFRYDVGFFIFGAECALLTLSTWSRSPDSAHRLRTIIRTLTLFSLGFAVVVMPIAIAFRRNLASATRQTGSARRGSPGVPQGGGVGRIGCGSTGDVLARVFVTVTAAPCCRM